MLEPRIKPGYQVEHSPAGMREKSRASNRLGTIEQEAVRVLQ